MRVLWLFLILLINVTTASAEWQYTEWGQSLEAVLENEGVQNTTPQERKDLSYPVIGEALAIAEYNAAEVRSRATFLFRKNRLVGVSLKVENSAAGWLTQSQLLDQYGFPGERNDEFKNDCRDINMSWRDAERGNVVTFNAYYCGDDQPSHFTVLYKPILKAVDTGL